MKQLFFNMLKIALGYGIGYFLFWFGRKIYLDFKKMKKITHVLKLFGLKDFYDHGYYITPDEKKGKFGFHGIINIPQFKEILLYQTGKGSSLAIPYDYFERINGKKRKLDFTDPYISNEGTAIWLGDFGIASDRILRDWDY